MRRLVVTLAAVVVMAAPVVAGVPTSSGVISSIPSAAAQVPGQPTHCGPWHQAWFVSAQGWWYFWWWRWCYNPSIQGGWYVDWAGWQQAGRAGPGYSAGFQYDTAPPAGATPGSSPGFQSSPQQDPGATPASAAGFQYDAPPP